MKRKLLTVFLIIAALIMLFAITSTASEVVEVWDISATENDNVTAYLHTDEANDGMYTLTITGTGNMKDWRYNGTLWYSYRDKITSVTIENGITTIGVYAFCRCSSLTSIVIGDSVTTIGSSAFRYCDSLTRVVIPNSVTTIGNAAFYDCDSLTSVVISDSVTTIDNAAFCSCSLTSIEVDEANQYYCSIDGNLYTKDKKTLVQYAIGKTATEFTIPSSVTRIGTSAFSNCDSLTSIVIPDSVTKIGNEAFSWCSSLTSVVIPDSVTTIGTNAFYDCDSLTSVAIGDSVTTIGIFAFDNCSSLTIYCEAESQPSGWNSYWNSSKRPVVWNYKVTLLENVFTFLGYSAREDGTGAICAGYEIDYEAIGLYESLTGETLEFGTVFASYENLNGQQPLNDDGTVVSLEKGKVIKQSLNNYTYGSYEFVLRDISDSIKDHSFVISLYVFNGIEVKYNQGSFSETVSGISYNQINQGE